MNSLPDLILSDVRLRLGGHDFRFQCTLPAGKIIAVTGPSGAGKSTFLNLLAGFETPDSGSIMLNDTDVTAMSPAERPVSLVFQDNNLFAHLDLFTNIGLGLSPSLRLSTDDRRLISDALARVGLKGFEKRMPGTLSGGERQRAAFARALIRDRPILLLDEPFASLDPSLRAGMADLLKELHRETGNTVLIVSHDPREVRQLADHAVFIDAGEIRLTAPIDGFLEALGLPALQRFLQI
ncbi:MULTISPECIES: thiamine ABC transporter ATP-binding protein [unclassified Rhizobium]|uniref:thiamine ABC transporter ATP-binding protein n=1 Tax=unclassified Rhizobium TaxID=2613769 RepID=UPI001ADD2C47|nr:MULTISPECIES: ATP-binding cassette domain-containing protein [unclassified Rhizobium]MBO9100244.1 ATP-binding cassette domain-containing protein [Rhizobium sp. L58/93]MBO9170210.1 ATP-binding cassette domain-containing protein [Rhizobium sp. L245/93]MBO9135599.1 ATP-binding cassette domain-containing protein [Rhizobium sp. B209b/85]QXZ83062.1 ATP-binding cassette domain-containing protein [Rhizobium sp. K1/93]QXZ89426.1 ATP-binding cassette domain-containing protein [Rhizobium sp. K15/93]